MIGKWNGSAILQVLRRAAASDPPRASNVRHQLFYSVAVTLMFGIPLFIWETHYMAWEAIDWRLAYYPASSLLWHGQNPFDIPNFHNPVWALLPLLPFYLLGEQAGGIAVFFASLFSFAFVAFRLGARLPAAVMLTLSPLMIYALYFDNIDWLVLWGFLLPPAAGLFFVALKPQVGLGVGLYWTYMAWRLGGWRAVVKMLAPLAAALLISYVGFGNWTRESSDHLLTNPWNMTLFPWSVPIGIALVFLAIRLRHVNPSISAAPFLSPYLNMGTWTTILIGILDRPWIMFAAFILLWLLFLTKTIIPVFG